MEDDARRSQAPVNPVIESLYSRYSGDAQALTAQEPHYPPKVLEKQAFHITLNIVEM
jgi:hypothetical protein